MWSLLVLLPEKQWEVMAGEVEQNLAEAMGKLKLTTGDGEDKSDVSGSENEHDDDSSDGNALTADQQLDFLFDSESEKNAERYIINYFTYCMRVCLAFLGVFGFLCVTLSTV